ncbi:hypothetical protein SLE2022_100180 [Rubroshorea leprosula]
MALRRALAKRLLNGRTITSLEMPPDHHATISPPSLRNTLPPNAAKTSCHREYLTSPDSADRGFFRRFLHRRASNQLGLAEAFSLPVGEKLREKLRAINTTGDRLWLEGLISPPAADPVAGDYLGKISTEDARKLLRFSLTEKLKAKLREIPMSSISYPDFVQICIEGCGNEEQGFEFAKMLDESGNVIVLGSIVFLRPEQVARSVETIISQTIAFPNDPRRRELDELEQQKAMIDKKAQALVRRELYCGLGFLVFQTLGAMRLTFWELTWDVMEPICFFVTSLHFALGYTFFLRTSTEPSFEGFFQRRFKAKQEKLMKIHNFDVEKYNKLRQAFWVTKG